jgi:hypothetical protein
MKIGCFFTLPRPAPKWLFFIIILNNGAYGEIYFMTSGDTGDITELTNIMIASLREDGPDTENQSNTIVKKHRRHVFYNRPPLMPRCIRASMFTAYHVSLNDALRLAHFLNQGIQFLPQT